MAEKKVAKKKAAGGAVKKTAAVKAPSKKGAAGKAAVKKAAEKKTLPVKKAPAVKAPVKKEAAPKMAPAPKPAAPVPAAPGTRKLTAKEVAHFKELLLVFRERVAGEYSTLSRDNLEANQRDPSLSDQGTDTFDREMELNMMGSEQEVLFEIDAALRRIEKDTYGICELTGLPINIERLQALPYVRYTVRAQSELEKGRARYRPFGGTMRG
jgi:RNA polymerase-binding protein DksA